MPVILHDGHLHITHLAVTAGDFPGLLRAHRREFPETGTIEREAQKLIVEEFEHNATIAFVDRVMRWGRGDRNVSRVLAQGIGMTTLVADAYTEAVNNGPASGLAVLEPIDYLGIPFASKLLRFLLPDAAVILDSVMRENLGYPESPRGYQTLLAECRSLLDHVRDQPYPLQENGRWRICDIEAAIYAKLQGY